MLLPAHMADTTYWYTYLNTPSNEQVTEFILRQYEILYDRYEQGRKHIVGDSSCEGDSKQQNQRLVEISYDELSQEPLKTAQKIYEKLGWKWTPSYQKRLETELFGREFKSYQKNRHKNLDPSMRSVINNRWGPSFERFGYTKE